MNDLCPALATNFHDETTVRRLIIPNQRLLEERQLSKRIAIVLSDL